MSHASSLSQDRPAGFDKAGAAQALPAVAAPLSVRRITAAEYRKLALEASDLDLRCLYQEPDWLDAYLSAISPARPLEPLFLAVEAEGEIAGLLPLAIESGMGGARTLTFLGWNRANQNQGLWSSSRIASADAGGLLTTLRNISKQAGADLIHLPNMPASLGPAANPLTSGHHLPSPSPVFTGSLDAPFETLLRQGLGKDGRKKLLRKKRALEEAGGYKVVEATSPGEREQGLKAFLEQREIRCRETGIPNAFSEAPDQDFLRRLITPNEAGEGLLRIFWLEVTGIIRATYICAWQQGCLSGYANSIAQDDMMPHSPGVVLLMDIIEKACADPAINAIDLGLGDERYKHAWTSPEPLHDALEALTFKGRTLLFVTEKKQALKARIRASGTLWPLVRKLRKWKASRRQAA
ncbi:GNAT family N-acetyltransferase [Roseibium suaedae]|uniref:Acetyltransferase involved in cellulose biosynthesis, CelD/BcsL family n=1 Tax=Roseibium suaedae TaxID=735517 RepID=A0A1M7CZ63_9HYPH|nr:GNAT family N-acetyltransferase [Roseibium suaedae]SHL72552.1 Acetyltransferase involved in cellulose biosynthesis, CelD/BcsL family [Roseibium suaedae]